MTEAGRRLELSKACRDEFEDQTDRHDETMVAEYIAQSKTRQ
jgi:hypothetical protein